MRNLVESIIVFSVYGNNPGFANYYEAIKAALVEIKKKTKVRFLFEFHQQLQKVVSHYTPSEESSERLMLKYYEQLILLRQYAKDSLSLSILSNLEAFPLHQDSGLAEYYERIADVVERFSMVLGAVTKNDRYYIHSRKPFFVNNQIYYEYSLVPAIDYPSKFDHVTAFSKYRIPDNYSIALSLKHSEIKTLETTLPIIIIDGWQVSIRPCELNGLSKLYGRVTRISGRMASYQHLMAFLTESELTLAEVASFEKSELNAFLSPFFARNTSCPIAALLVDANRMLIGGSSGKNVLRYLLYRPRQRVINDQLQNDSNSLLGGMCLKNGCIPFEEKPYCTALCGHETSIKDLLNCIDPAPYSSDLLARFISGWTQKERSVYVPENEVDQFEDIDSLISAHNASLYRTHADRQIVHEMGHVFVRGDEKNVSNTVRELLALSQSGISGYENSCDVWLSANPGIVDDPNKESSLRELFSNTRVALIYGSAGTGKTTMVDLVCSVFSSAPKIAIANTNPAVDSLKRRVRDPKCSCMTITKYLSEPRNTGLLIIDECSTVNNAHMAEILSRGGFSALLLVGDVRQIESIKLGNWFELAEAFLPEKCLHHFEKPWRATSSELVRLWASVRENAVDVAEILEANGMVSNLDSSIFTPLSEDEIVLCLNYDGLYGINNVNKLMQIANQNEPVLWGLNTYKVGDPVLFNESGRFRPLLYNNLKGEIVRIEKQSDSITFDISVDLALTELDLFSYSGIKLVDSKGGSSIVRFQVKKEKDPDADGTDSDCVTPFQIAYAVSIHKAQGLEYDSVKLVITGDSEKRITHSIFYTAITRARKELKIYWSPEAQATVLSSLEVPNCNRDACLLAQRFGLKLHP